LVTVNYKILEVFRLREVDNGDRDVEQKAFNKSARSSVVPDILSLNLGKA
jgi:hypothetical protein